MPSSIAEIAALVLVGAFWGCTNPLLRQGSLGASSSSSNGQHQEQPQDNAVSSWTYYQLRKFRHVRVWFPYAINQCGSILFYLALSQTDLSLAVPIANALALVFSVATTVWWTGERLHRRPVQTVVGAALIVGGVALCSWEATTAKSRETKTSA